MLKTVIASSLLDNLIYQLVPRQMLAVWLLPWGNGSLAQKGETMAFRQLSRVGYCGRPKGQQKGIHPTGFQIWQHAFAAWP